MAPAPEGRTGSQQNFYQKKKACFGSDGGGPDLRPVATIDADAPATQHKCCNMPAAAAAAYEL